MQPGLYLDISEADYHSDALDPALPPSLSASIAESLVLKSEAHAHMRHPRLGGQPFVPTNDMDRGTLIHALLLGKGRECAIIECDDWKKPGNRELRDSHRAEGRLAVTRKLYDQSIGAAKELQKRLAAKGYPLSGDSEVTVLWRELAENGNVVHCRARMDHVQDTDIFDLKITGDANPRTITRGHLTRMGYDVQAAAYTRALDNVLCRPGRSTFTLLFCEPEPPYCITPVRLAGSLRELGNRKWLRSVNTWERCLRTNIWNDYTDGVVFAEARPWELDEEESEAAFAGTAA
jgi:hypothetical protein